MDASSAPYPTITNVDDLFANFKVAPFGIAPERMHDLLAINEQLGIQLQLQDDPEHNFSFKTFFNTIFSSRRSLHHIWAASLRSACFYLARQGAIARNETEVYIDSHPDLKEAHFLYEGSCAYFSGKAAMPWPFTRDTIEQHFSNEAVVLANEFFLLTCSFILLHEIAHLVLEHTKAHDSSKAAFENPYQLEFEADKWAYDWALSKCPGEDPKFFAKRALAVGLALGMMSEFEFLKESEDATHPPAIDRFEQFLKNYGPQIHNNPWGGTCYTVFVFVVQVLIRQQGAEVPEEPFETIEEFLKAAKKALYPSL